MTANLEEARQKLARTGGVEFLIQRVESVEFEDAL